MKDLMDREINSDWATLSEKEKGVLHRYSSNLGSYLKFTVCRTVSREFTRNSEFMNNERRKFFRFNERSKSTIDDMFFSQMVIDKEQQKLKDGATFLRHFLTFEERNELQKEADKFMLEAMKDAIK
jgi:hypothetical protein